MEKITLHRSSLYAAAAVTTLACIGLFSALSVSQGHTKEKSAPAAVVTPRGKAIATLAAGCFWSMEAMFKQLKGVETATPGYAGGSVVDPTYHQVCGGQTGHAESIDIIYNPNVISYSDLVLVMLRATDPTTLNRQGPDEGTQYRSAIFFRTHAEKVAATATINKVNAAHLWPNPIVTEVVPIKAFYPAESYHHNYYNLHPDQSYCKNVIAPKIEHFRKLFDSKLKATTR